LEKISNQIYGRSWKGFAEWLEKNILETYYRNDEECQRIRVIRQRDYPYFSEYKNSCYSNLYLFYYVKQRLGDDIYFPLSFHEYDENKAFLELIDESKDDFFLKQMKEGKWKEVKEEFERMLKEYRQSPLPLRPVKWRSWLNFIDWLDDNFIDKEKREKVKELGKTKSITYGADIWRDDKKRKYVFLKQNLAPYNIIYEGLWEFSRGFTDKLFRHDIRDAPSPTFYEENKEMRFLFPWKKSYWGNGIWPRLLQENEDKMNEFWCNWERLFLEWKLATPLQIIREYNTDEE
jgi:hypothetical protein